MIETLVGPEFEDKIAVIRALRQEDELINGMLDSVDCCDVNDLLDAVISMSKKIISLKMLL
ncbi:MAG: hypothetical protein GY718_10130 [Lentisphaerae bacterium]|nr:hypothetical protein [Lentisphaerota bacterium]